MSTNLSNLQQLTVYINLAASLFLYISIFSDYVKHWPRLAKLGYALLSGSLLIEAILSVLFYPPPFQEEIRAAKSIAILILSVSLSAVMLWKRHSWRVHHVTNRA